MPRPEQLELEAHREQLEADVRGLVDKYPAISEWDLPAIDEALAGRLVVTAIRQTLNHMEKS